MFGWFKKKSDATKKSAPVIGPPISIGPPPTGAPAAKAATPAQPAKAQPAATQPAKGSSAKGPDFSPIDSREKAEHFFRQGKLEKMLLFPEMFGGEDIPQNTLYVPIGVGAAKVSFEENVITPLAEEGLLNKYTATPEYHNNSVIPIAIKIVASGEREVTSTINIWGPALDRE